MRNEFLADESVDFHSVLIHLSIHPETGNIWIQQNNTEIQIDIALRELAEVPNEHLVLGFLPVSMRSYSEYAVA
ncbi:MAG: element excision factor XisI family protein [Bacteroidota bacterium]